MEKKARSIKRQLEQKSRGEQLEAYIHVSNKHAAFRGIYHGEIYLASGRRRWFSCKTRNQAEAEIFYIRFAEKLLQDALFAQRYECKLSDFAKLYIEENEARRLAKSTMDEIKLQWNDLVSFVRIHGNKGENDPTLRYLRPELIIGFIGSPSKKKKSNPSSSAVNKRITWLRAGFRRAMELGYLDDNPLHSIKLARVVTVDRIPLEQEDVLAIGADKNLVHESDMWKHRFLMLSFLLGTRSSELCNVRIEDIDLSARLLRIKQTESYQTKTLEDHVLDLFDTDLDLIREQLAWKLSVPVSSVQQSPYLFPRRDGTRYTSSNISKHLNPILRRLFPDRPELTVHCARHGHAAYLDEAGIPLEAIGKRLNQKSERTTLRYVHRKKRPPEIRPALRLLSSKLRPRPEAGTLVSDTEGSFESKQLSQLPYAFAA